LSSDDILDLTDTLNAAPTMGGGGSKSKKKQRVNSHDKAVLDLKVQRDKLKQYQKQCETVMKRET
jgi:hypothetical protein